MPLLCSLLSSSSALLLSPPMNLILVKSMDLLGIKIDVFHFETVSLECGIVSV